MNFFRSKKSIVIVLLLICILCTSCDISNDYNYYSDYWNGKTGIFIGDSLIEQGMITNALKNQYEIIVQNEGVSGSTIAKANKTTEIWAETVDRVDGEADFIFILIGTNDYSEAVQIGSDDDITADTFYGAWNLLLQKIIDKWPNTTVFVATIPARDSIYDEELGVDGISSNKEGISLATYNDCIRGVVAKWNCSLVDLYEFSGMTVENVMDYTDDGIHPNSGGVFCLRSV